MFCIHVRVSSSARVYRVYVKIHPFLVLRTLIIANGKYDKRVYVNIHPFLVLQTPKCRYFVGPMSRYTFLSYHDLSFVKKCLRYALLS